MSRCPTWLQTETSLLLSKYTCNPIEEGQNTLSKLFEFWAFELLGWSHLRHRIPILSRFSGKRRCFSGADEAALGGWWRAASMEGCPTAASVRGAWGSGSSFSSSPGGDSGEGTHGGPAAELQDASGASLSESTSVGIRDRALLPSGFTSAFRFWRTDQSQNDVRKRRSHERLMGHWAGRIVHPVGGCKSATRHRILIR